MRLDLKDLACCKGKLVEYEGLKTACKGGNSLKRIRTLLVIGLILAIVSGAALATVAWQKAFNDLYKPKAGTALAKAKCQICHTQKTGGALNPYGTALKGKKADAASLKSVEKLDSDKDGKTNIQEIKAGKLPGDAKSK